MKKDQNLQKLNNNVFNKICIFFKNLFYYKSKKATVENLEQNMQTTKEKKDDFRKNIEINCDRDRIILLKQKFDNRMIDVKDIPMKDKIKLLEMYKKNTGKI